MSDNPETITGEPTPSFFARTGVQTEALPIGPGIPFGLERVYSAELGIGGVYGSWGASYDNAALRTFIEGRLGQPMQDDEMMNLAELGFLPGERVWVLAHGPLGREPVAVRVGTATLALRRHGAGRVRVVAERP